MKNSVLFLKTCTRTLSGNKKSFGLFQMWFTLKDVFLISAYM